MDCPYIEPIKPNNMLIALIISAIALLMGGDESEFASSIPKLEKEIRRNVVEESRKDSLLVLVKAYEKEIKAYEKANGKLQKKLQKTSADYTKSTAEFLEVYDAYYSSKVDLISSLIDLRILFQQQVTEEELQLIVEKALEDSKKDTKKAAKGEEKIEKYLGKAFEDINKVVAKHIDDAAAVTTLSNILGDIEEKVYEFIEEALVLNQEKKRMLDDKNATQEDLDELFEASGDLRFLASRDYARFREEAIKNTTERQWKAINKELKALSGS